jgi:acyl carrier protein
MKNIIENSEYKQGICRELTKILREESGEFEVPAKYKIKEETELSEIGLEDFGIYEFALLITERYNIHFSDKKISKLKTLGDCINHIAIKGNL